MANFAEVLRKTIDGMGNSTPEARERVYQKARATVEEKLAAVNAGPEAASRQRKALAQAIVEVERGYAARDGKAKVARAAPAKQPLAPQGRIDSAIDPASAESLKPPSKPSRTKEPAGQQKGKPGPASSRAEPAAKANATPRSEFDDILFGPESRPDEGPAPVSAGSKAKPGAWGAAKRKGPRVPLVAVIAVVAVVVVGLAGWGLMYEFGLFGSTDQASPAPSQQAAALAPAKDEAQTSGDVAGGSAATRPADKAAAASQPEGAPQASDKFTQRLLASGEEVNPGPAVEKPSVGEGTSLAAQSAKPADADASQQAAQQTAVQQDQAGSSAAATVPVGQKAFFYEERTGEEASTAETGAVVWSEVQQSPGDDMPPEPAIRAEVTIPQNGMKLRLTIQRNADKSLPASHLVELVFSVPDGFRGGSIDNVQRVAFKETEQVAGNPLVAIPAKIADNFFIVALNDAATAVQTNLGLMQREEWIDIPMTYRSGRRALITLEKGVPGDKVFEDVLKAWAEKTSG